MKSKKEQNYRINDITWTSFIFLLIFSICCYSQSKVSLSVQQDVKFASIGDKQRGYDAFTPDVLIRFKMQGNEKGLGYLNVWPELEYAAIDGDYYRYSANVGYSFNQLILKNFEVTPYIGYGFIDRYGKCFSSFGGGIELGYNFSDSFKLVSTLQATERKDLKWLWNTDKIGFSWFIGIEYAF